MTSIYEFSAQPMSGKPVPLKKYKGKALLIVNTASACGFTPQFAGLETLHETWGPKGLVVLGFPCNQFGSKAIKWNFTKFLVGKDGQVIRRYAPTDTPESLTKDIEQALAA